MSITEKIHQLIPIVEDVLNGLGFVLVDLRLSQQGKRRVLEVTIHRAAGRVSLEDCEKASRQLDDALDSQSPPVIDGSYLLEVQSPGIDRQLKTDREFAIFTGQPVKVEAKERIAGLGACFEGLLVAASQGLITIEHPRRSVPPKKRSHKGPPDAAPPEVVELPLTQLVSVRLVPQMLAEQKPIDLATRDFSYDLNGTDN